MNRLYSFFISVLLCSFLIACGSNNEASNQDTNNDTASSAVTDTADSEPQPEEDEDVGEESSETPADTAFIPAELPTTAAMGESIEAKRATITITDLVSGAEAAELIQAEQNNEAAPEGYEYVVLTADVTNTSDQGQRASMLYNMGITGNTAKVYPQVLVTGLASGYSDDIEPNETKTVQTAYLVPTSLTGRLAVVYTSLFDTSDLQLIALEAGAQVPTLAASPLNSGTGEAITVNGWQFQVAEVIRGDEAAQFVSTINQFQQPMEGQAYFGLRINGTYSGASGTALGALEPIGFTLEDASGNQYMPFSVANFPQNLNEIGFPGMQFESWLFFEIQPDAEDLTLMYYDMQTGEERSISIQ